MVIVSGVGSRASGVNHDGRGRLRRGASLLAAGVLLAVGTLHGQFPEPRGPVNDFADLLTDAEERTLSDLAEAVEAETTAEIAVATLTSLDGMPVEEYANRLFAQWGIGQADKDNGVLILVAPNEREMRIEVGYGLEEILPDGLAGQIIRESFTPAFRDGEYARGILDGTARVAAIVRRNQPLTAEQRAALERATAAESEIPIEWLLVPFFGLFVVHRHPDGDGAAHRLANRGVDPGGPRRRGLHRGSAHRPEPEIPRRTARFAGELETRLGLGPGRKRRERTRVVRLVGRRLVGRLQRRQFRRRRRERAVVMESGVGSGGLEPGRGGNPRT